MSSYSSAAFTCLCCVAILTCGLSKADAQPDSTTVPNRVALIEDDVTVKRLIKKDGATFLHAENKAYPDIYPSGEWSIQGKVVGLIRVINPKCLGNFAPEIADDF